MRKIKARRQALEVSKHEAQECQTLVPIEAPMPSQTSLMTQAAPPKVQEASQTDAWTCECSARLRRHPRCSAPGELQPKIVYISKETMVVGRLHTCDVVIDA